MVRKVKLSSGDKYTLLCIGIDPEEYAKGNKERPSPSKPRVEDPTPRVEYWYAEYVERELLNVIRASVTDEGKRPAWRRNPLSLGFELPSPEDVKLAMRAKLPPVGQEYARILAYRLGSPGRPVTDALCDLDMISDIGAYIFAELDKDASARRMVLGEDDFYPGIQFILIDEIEADPKRKRYGTALMRRFLEHCPQVASAVVYHPHPYRRKRKDEPDPVSEFFGSFGFERPSPRSPLLVLPYEQMRFLDPQSLRESEAEMADLESDLPKS